MYHHEHNITCRIKRYYHQTLSIILTVNSSRSGKTGGDYRFVLCQSISWSFCRCAVTCITEISLIVTLSNQYSLILVSCSTIPEELQSQQRLRFCFSLLQKCGDI